MIKGLFINIRKTAIAGLISLAALAPNSAKAQKTVQFISEVGITGVVRKDPLFYGGMNFGFPRGKNYTDLFAGMNLNTDKQVAFLGLAMNNYNWTKNISSWVREVFVASKRTTSSTLEVSPIRVNISAGKFDISFNPAYTMYNDFRTGTTTQGINTILQTTYSMTTKDKIFVEAKYTSEPAKNLFNTRFGKFADNISYMVSYMRTF